MAQRFFTLLCIGILLAARHGVAQTQTAPLRNARSNDVAAGKRVFDAQCAWCHGTDGVGGNGPNLQRAALKHATDDASLVRLVLNGIPDTEMPSFVSALTQKMAWQTAAYVRALGRAPTRAMSGDPTRGAALYERSGCAGCHVVAGRGNMLGPDLTSIGTQRGASHLKQSLIDPAAAHPPGYLVVKATTTTGIEVRGIRVNEDVFWVLVRDVRGNIHSIQKSELTSLDREPAASLMPSYSDRLSASELDDVVAYLVGLKGTP